MPKKSATPKSLVDMKTGIPKIVKTTKSTKKK